MKIFLGNVYLTIPPVFARTGIIGGILLYVTIAILNTYTMIAILKISTEMSKKKLVDGTVKSVKSYSELGKRLWGPKGKILVDTALFIT